MHNTLFSVPFVYRSEIYIFQQQRCHWTYGMISVVKSNTGLLSLLDDAVSSRVL